MYKRRRKNAKGINCSYCNRRLNKKNRAPIKTERICWKCARNLAHPFCSVSSEEFSQLETKWS